MNERLRKILRFRDERNILTQLRIHGISKSKVERLPEHFDRKPDPDESYYYYDGPLDDKTRAFCKQMLKLDKVWSQDDIDIVSRYLNYSVIKYKGSYNCRHRWVLFRGKLISTPEPTAGQIRSLINKGIKAK